MASVQASRLLPIEYGATVGAARTDTMIYWLARAARELREAGDRKQVHVAAELNVDQSTIYRFELGEAWPRQADSFVAGYAEDLDIGDAREIWELALRLWKEEGEAPNLDELLEQTRDLRQARAEVAQRREELDRLRRSTVREKRKRAGGER